MGTQGKHTPGPWYWDEGWGAICAGEDRRNPDMLVTPMWKHGTTAWGDETNSANAQLISAAPELLEACKRTLEKAQVLWDDANGGTPVFSEQELNVLRSAIARAEGRA